MDTVHVPGRESDLARAARAGAAAITPLVVAFAPFALIVGSTIGAAAHRDAGIAGSWLIYGGSAQIATARTLEAGGAVLAVFTALLINLRLLIYSASLSQHWQAQPRWFRVSAAPFLVDPVWAVAEAHARTSPSPREERAHYFGAALTLFVAWSVCVTTGVVLGSRLSGPAFQVTAPLCLLALVAPRLTDARSRRVAVAATIGALAGRGMPSGTSIFVAIVAGCIAGQMLEGAER